jgi:hypothetical protein
MHYNLDVFKDIHIYFSLSSYFFLTSNLKINLKFGERTQEIKDQDKLLPKAFL